MKNLKSFSQLNEENSNTKLIRAEGREQKTRVYEIDGKTIKIEFDEIIMTENVDHGYGTGYAVGTDDEDNEWNIDVDCNIDNGSGGPEVDEWHDETLEMVKSAK
jgi:hypothetical protein